MRREREAVDRSQRFRAEEEARQRARSQYATPVAQRAAEGALFIPPPRPPPGPPPPLPDPMDPNYRPRQSFSEPLRHSFSETPGAEGRDSFSGYGDGSGMRRSFSTGSQGGAGTRPPPGPPPDDDRGRGTGDPGGGVLVRRDSTPRPPPGPPPPISDYDPYRGRGPSLVSRQSFSRHSFSADGTPPMGRVSLSDAHHPMPPRAAPPRQSKGCFSFFTFSSCK